MFEYLKGEVAYKKPEYLALDVNGVGYKIFISLKTYDSVAEGETKRFLSFASRNPTSLNSSSFI